MLTDHTQSLTIARGLTPERVEQQRRVIGELNEARSRGGVGEAEGASTVSACCTAASWRSASDGRLDYDDELLARYDVVVASRSTSAGASPARSSWRATGPRCATRTSTSSPTRRAARSASATTSISTGTPFYREAAETRTVLEVNGSDERLDLDDRRARAALDAGNRFVIDSDAHYRHEFDNLDWGVAIARRGWLEADDVLNTRSRDSFLAWMRGDRSV